MTKSEKGVLKAGLPMENCVSTLQMNAESSVLYAGKGRGLLEQIGREGMNEFFAGESEPTLPNVHAKSGE